MVLWLLYVTVGIPASSLQDCCHMGCWLTIVMEFEGLYAKIILGRGAMKLLTASPRSFRWDAVGSEG